jgi:hypothetical protein
MTTMTKADPVEQLYRATTTPPEFKCPARRAGG